MNLRCIPPNGQTTELFTSTDDLWAKVSVFAF
jgi:hypothetical protein